MMAQGPLSSEESTMPTYQYRCTECGHDLEAVQKFSDPSLTECPNCRGQLRKIFNAVGVVFKGSGFYRTDSRENGKTKVEAGSSDKASPKAEGGKETATTGAKAETKTSSGSTSESGSSASTNGKQSVAAGASSTGSKPSSS